MGGQKPPTNKQDPSCYSYVLERWGKVWCALRTFWNLKNKYWSIILMFYCEETQWSWQLHKRKLLGIDYSFVGSSSGSTGSRKINILSLAWAFENPKLTPSVIHPPTSQQFDLLLTTRPHLLNAFNIATPWWPITQMHEPMGNIFIQTTILIFDFYWKFRTIISPSGLLLFHIKT